ncbi:alanine racemase [Streptomyces sp. NPDC092296]|uniref:alanine racemase n=1 Tax=Streptomyces sp. NPDC092296 TaxID=3366012 RepID=UPI0037FDF941
MALSLYVETARWRAHQQSVLDAFPGLVPVAKGNGYGFGNRRLAEEATRLGAPMLAVGTSYEARDAVEDFGGDVLVLTPYRIGEDPVPLPGRVVRTVASVSGVRALVGRRVVVECMTSMRRHGINPEDVAKLGAALDDVRLEGFALHLPLDHPDGYDPVQECTAWIGRLTAAGLPIPAVYVSHLSAEELGRLRGLHPGTVIRPRIGTRLWLGDHGALDCRGTVLDVTPVVKGDRYGYRQLKAPMDGHLVVVAGGTAHGVGLEAPKHMTGVTPRAKNLARAGLATVNRTVSPFSWGGRKAAFAEPPHMQVSILFVPGDTAPPTVGEELRATLRHTTTYFDRTVDR